MVTDPCYVAGSLAVESLCATKLTIGFHAVKTLADPTGLLQVDVPTLRLPLLVLQNEAKNCVGLLDGFREVFLVFAVPNGSIDGIKQARRRKLLCNRSTVSAEAHVQAPHPGRNRARLNVKHFASNGLLKRWVYTREGLTIGDGHGDSDADGELNRSYPVAMRGSGVVPSPVQC